MPTDERCDCGHTIDMHSNAGCIDDPAPSQPNITDEIFCACTKTHTQVSRELHPRWFIARDRDTDGEFPWRVECPGWFRTSAHRKANHAAFCERCDVFPSHASALQYVREQIRGARSFRREVAVL